MKELTDFQKEYIESLKQKEQEELSKYETVIFAFREFMKGKGIILQNENFKYFTTSGIIATYPRILQYLHDSLIPDKEGLFQFSDLQKNFKIRPFSTGYLVGDNFMLMAHPNFRRGFHQINNFSPRFVELYWDFNDSRIDKFIALDNDAVRINLDGYGYMERDTWFGAQFDREISSIPDGTVKLRPPLDLEEFYIRSFFSSAYSLDIKWTTKDGIKSFQAEEFKSEDILIEKDGAEYFPVRYVHAEFDIQKGYFRHFDGAIHYYTLDEYLDRRDSDFNYNSKNSNHIKTLSKKLFKLNGEISVEIWIEFTSHFFTGNPLVFEYFDGAYPQHVVDMIEKVKNLPKNSD